MPEMQFDERQIANLLHEKWRERTNYIDRMHGRRLLLNLGSDIEDDPKTGTWLPSPYDESTLIIKSLIGDVSDVLDNYSSRISTNEPQISVIPLLPTKKEQISPEAESEASEQERLLMSQWQAAGGRSAQRQVAYSQSWGRVGWYFTLPRDAQWGLPARRYFSDLSDDEIEEMKRTGKIAPDADEGGSFKESGESWMERRRHAAQENAISGTSLFTLDAYPPDMVLPEYERNGTAERTLKWGFIVEEVPVTEFMPGSEMARAAARTALAQGSSTDLTTEDIDRYGIYLNEDGEIEGGVTAGGEWYSQNAKRRFVRATFVTRSEVYTYVAESTVTGGGVIVHHENHGADEVPLYAVPAKHTDSLSPGAEFSSPMESIFASSPLINQLETLLSNVASWNALGRFYIVNPQTHGPLTDEEGNMITLSQEDVVGLDPGQLAATIGEVQQITLDASLLLETLTLYLTRFDQSKPSPVTEGVAGASAAAWQVRQLLTASDELLQEPVENHAGAVQKIQRLWVRWMRMIDEPIYAFAIPNQRQNDRVVRGLIEFDPKDLISTVRVEQSSQSAQQRIALRAAGQEELAQGLIGRKRYYEEFALDQDPMASMLEADIGMVSDLLMTGNVDNIQPGSLLADTAEAIRGELAFEALARSPSFLLAEAERMEARAQAALAPVDAPTGFDGNLSQATGTVEPGLGMNLQQGGGPDTQAPPGVA